MLILNFTTNNRYSSIKIVQTRINLKNKDLININIFNKINIISIILKIYLFNSNKIQNLFSNLSSFNIQTSLINTLLNQNGKDRLTI